MLCLASGKRESLSKAIGHHALCWLCTELGSLYAAEKQEFAIWCSCMILDLGTGCAKPSVHVHGLVFRQ